MPAIAISGACLYIKRSTLDRVGLLNERYPMMEDADYCLRAWRAGLRVLYEPGALLVHAAEPAARGREQQREREMLSPRQFWDRWGDSFDARPVRTSSGRLRIIYVTQDCSVAGGHRVVFEHLNRLSRRGHACELYTLEGPPDWFPLDVPVRVFPCYSELSKCLALEDAIKVATWWKTAEAVWLASVAQGVPVYLVQDIEANFYPGDRDTQDRVMASYREEFRFVATSTWIRDQLCGLGLTAELVAPGVDLETFRDLGIARRDDVLLSVGRRQAIKNLISPLKPGAPCPTRDPGCGSMESSPIRPGPGHALLPGPDGRRDE